MVDALAVHDLELGLFEGRRYLVLDDFYAGFVTDHFVALFDSTDAADVQAYGGVEFQGVTAGGGFRAKCVLYLKPAFCMKEINNTE
ncbi:hypothetical protein MAALD49_13380 [Marinobacter shengliensis]|nr:hypothetical protein MAALD49_13380 [Marinobacter shengliensis]